MERGYFERRSNVAMEVGDLLFVGGVFIVIRTMREYERVGR